MPLSEATPGVEGLPEHRRPPEGADGDRLLSRGGGFKAHVRLHASSAGPVVIKDFGGERTGLARLVGRWLCAREIRAYRRLEGIASVPALYGRIDGSAFALEYRPGVMLTRSLAGRLPEDFMPHLDAAIRAMHARGVVHLDLRHRSNVLAGEDGRPVLIDFTSAICLSPRRWLGRLLIRWLGAFDRRAIAKWRVRIEPDQAVASVPAPLGASEAPTGGSAGSRGTSLPM